MSTFFITNMGCNRRSLDSQRIKNYFEVNRHIQVDSAEEADNVVITTCGLSRFHEDSCFSLIEEYRKLKGRLIVFGCLPAMNKPKMLEIFEGDIVHTRNIDFFDEIFPDFEVGFAAVPDPNKLLKEVHVHWKDKIKSVLGEMDLYYFLKIYNVWMILLEKARCGINGIFPSFFPVPLITRVPLVVANSKDKYFSLRISKGCRGRCSFCNIRKAIGPLKSKALSGILDEVKKGVTEGQYRLNLLSSDPGSYGVDIDCSFPEMLKAIFAVDERVCIDLLDGLHPGWLCKYEVELVELVKLGRIKTIVIPVQSGNKRILKLMCRSTAVEQSGNAIEGLRKAFPRIRLATQIIVGFPSETEAEFQDTVSLLQQCRFCEVDIFQYYETSATDSVVIEPKVPTDVVVDRMRRLQMSLPLGTITHVVYADLKKK